MFAIRTGARLTNAVTQPKFSGDPENAIVRPGGAVGSLGRGRTQADDPAGTTQGIIGTPPTT